MNQLSPEGIRELIFGFQKSRIILTAFELNIFSYLDKQSIEAEELASQIKTDIRATDRLLNALVGLGLLMKDKNKFWNSDFASQFLVEGKTDYLSGIGHSVNLWNSWTTLTPAVRKGTSVFVSRIADRGDEWLKSFIGAMHDRGKLNAKDNIKDIDLNGINSMIDVGGGSGVYSMAFVEKKYGLKSTIFDLKEVVPITKYYIAKEGYEVSINTKEGDYTVDELGGSYDMAFLSAVIHSNSYSVNLELIRNCYRALRTNGKIVIQDYIMNNERTEPVGGAVFALNMLVGTEAGDCYTKDEITKWFDESGFRFVSMQNNKQGTSIIIGERI